MALKFVQTGNIGAGGTGGGTYDHNLLVNRGLPDQHTIESITGLRNALDRKYEKPFTGIPKTDLGFGVATTTDIDFLRKTDLADMSKQINSLIAEVTDARNTETTLREYIDTKVSYSEWSGGGGGTGGGIGSQIGYPINEKVIAAEGQTTFILPKKYRVGTGQLEVYYDGLKMVEGDDYTEVDELTVELKFSADAGSMVLFQVRAVINSGLHEEYAASTGQTMFKLVSPYGMGQNILQVFRNGNLLRKGRDYKEIDDITVEMTIPMLDGDYITFHQAGATDPVAGTLLDSEIGRVKVNLGYTTMLLHDATQTTNTDYVDMFVDTFITDKNIDEKASFEYGYIDHKITVEPIFRTLSTYEDFSQGVVVDADVDTYPGIIHLGNLPGGADRHVFGTLEKKIDGKRIEDLITVMTQNRTKFTLYSYEDGSVKQLAVDILTNDQTVPVTILFNTTAGSFGSLAAAVDHEGYVHVVFHETGGPDPASVWYGELDHEGLIGSWEKISDAGYESINPAIALDDSGVSHVVFQSKRVNPDFYNIDYVSIGSLISSPKDLTIYNSLNARTPKIAVGKDGRARVVFDSMEYDGATRNLKLIVMQSGIKMYEDFITASNSFDNVAADIVIAPDDSLRIAWRSRRLNAVYGIDFCHVSKSNLVSSVKSIATGPLCERPRIAIDALGITHIVFNAPYTRSDTQNICYAMAYDAHNASQVFDIASSVGREYRNPDIDVHGTKVNVGFISDVDGFSVSKSLANYTNSGSFEMIFDTKTPDSEWLDATFSIVKPEGTDIGLNYRISGDQVGWSAWRSLDDIEHDVTVGRYIQIRVTLMTNNPDITPELSSLSVAYKPTFIEIVSTKKASAKDVDGIIPIAQYTGIVTFEVSRDGGTTFVAALKDRVADTIGTPSGRDVVIKAKISQDAVLDAWGAIW